MKSSKSNDAKAAISKYLRLSKEIEQTKRESPAANYFQDISGSYIDRRAADALLMHLQESTELDVERDQFRAMLAGEYWRQRRFGEAKAEFERIVARGLSHLHVAQTMLEEIRRVIDTEALDGAKSSDGP